MHRARMAIRLVGIIVALGAATGATPTRAGTAPSHPVRNGAIAFWGGTKIYAIEPDGSGLRVLVPDRRRNCVIPAGRKGWCYVSEFAWSASGRQLAFLHGSSVYGYSRARSALDMSLFRIGADGHGERRIAGCGHPWPSCRGFSSSPDGSQIVVSRYDGLFVVNANGRTVRQLTGSRVDRSPRWSPDGSKIAFVRTPHGRSSAVYVTSAPGSRATRLPGTVAPSDVQWSSDSSSVVFHRGDRLIEVPADGSRLPSTMVDSGISTYPTLSPDGKGVAYNSESIVHRGTGGRADKSTARPEIWTMRSSGRRRWRVYAGAVGIGGDRPLAPTWSPNGKRIAFADDAIYVVDADGGRLRRLSTLGHESLLYIGREVAWQPSP